MDDLPTTASAFLGSVTPPPAGYIYQFGFAALIDPAATGAGICFPGDSFFTGTLGSSTQETVKVTDCGDAPLIISKIQISGAAFVIDLPDLGGSALLRAEDFPVYSLVEFEGD